MIHHFEAKGTNAGLDFDIELAPDKKVYCFIGENGCGKTQLLENLAKSLIASQAFIDEEELEKIRYKFLATINRKVENIGKIYFELPKNIIINKNLVKDKNSEFNVVEINNFILDKRNKSLWNIPIIFLGTKSRGYTKNINIDNIKILGNTEERFLETYIFLILKFSSI
jgi:energy-coupling factor transporter ATP-binding protein EcfA2